MRHRHISESTRNRVDATIDAALLLANRGYHLTHNDSNDQAILLPYTPVARQNAFQQLLYRKAWEHGVAPIPISNPDDILGLPWPGQMICHFHWLAPWTAEATSLSQAKDSVTRFRDFTLALKDINCKICWTMHNILPHDSRWIDQDIQIRQEISNSADMIHIMAKDSLNLARPYFTVAADKVFQTPHPNYDRVYQDFVSRTTARNELEIADNDFMILAFGAIEPYKGTEDLLEGFQIVSDKLKGRASNLKLVIAGKCASKSLARSITGFIAGNPNITWTNRKIPPDEVQYYYHAADVAACPYTKFLNSGAALLANTFNCRIIAPKRGIFSELITDGVGRVYNDEKEKASAIATCIEQEFEYQQNVSEPLKARAVEIQNCSSEQTSNTFFSELRKRVDGGMWNLQAQPIFYR